MVSRPTRARGLKRRLIPDTGHRLQVAPHAGAWIETFSTSLCDIGRAVAPHAGAWIETDADCRDTANPWGRAPRGRVD